MGRGVDQRKLAEWRRRIVRQESSGLSVAAFCRREGVSVSLWKYWQRQVAEVARVHGGTCSRHEPAMPFTQLEIIPRRSVFLRFPGGSTMEIPDDRVDLVRLVIDRMTAPWEAGPC